MKKRMGESGNIFFTLFGAVALVGVVGAATSTLMRGPVGTVVALNQRAKADSQMQIAMKLAMLEAQNNSSDCDGDTYIEPIGAGAAIAGLNGGGRLPSVGSTTNDPWGSPYGYCAWNHGSDTTSNCSGGTTPLLQGHAAGQGTVLAVISAGPDRQFGVTCMNAPAANAPYITRGANGADDLIVSMTYAEANEASGGLWSIKSGDPDKITTSRELDVSTGAQFSGNNVSFSNPVTSFAKDSKLDLTAGSLFMLPTELQMTGCSGALDKGLLRRFTDASNGGGLEVLQICDGAGWLDIGGAGAIVAAAGAPGQIQYNAAGVMGASGSLVFNSNNGLTVGGDSIFSSDVRVNQTLRVNNALNVTGNSVLTGTLDVDGAADFDSTIDVALGATFGSWLRGSDGTSTAPTYSFTSDTDSGIFFSSNALRFSVDGTERMAVSAGGATMVAGQVLGNFGVAGTLTTTDLSVANSITANRFISRMASTSATNPAFETEPGTGMYSAVDNTLSLVAGGTPRIIIDGTGDVGIGVLSPNAKLDVSGEIKIGTSSLPCGVTLHGAIRYVSGDLLQVCSSETSSWEDIGTSGGGGGGAASYWTRISAADRRLYYDKGFVGIGTNNPLDDFHVEGDFLATGSYTGTPSVAVSGAGARMFFDPEGSAFRAGGVTASQWDSGSIGGYSAAMGFDVMAQGLASAAFGRNVSATGENAFAYGLGISPGAAPLVSGARSYGIFMGDQSGVNLAATNTMALLGGRFLIDQTPALNPVVSGTLSLDVEGGVGAMQYCDENGLDCFTAASIASGGLGAPGNNRELMYNSGGVLGANPNMVFSSAGNLTLGGTGAIKIPEGSDLNRPLAPVAGMLRYNSVTGKFEGYQGTTWLDIITSAVYGGAAAPNRGIQFNNGGNFSATPNFQYTSGGSFLISGTHTGAGDATLPTGDGVRMFFDTTKAALRAGRVLADQWDNASVGGSSVAMGSNTRASGDSSTAMGSFTTASGVTSLAMGTSTIASGNSSTAMGGYTTASGANSTAMGGYTTASGANSTAMGGYAKAIGADSLAIGSYTTASGINSIALGKRVVAGDGAAANGFGDGSMAIGLVDDAVTITTPPQVRGMQSLGIFMGNQSGAIVVASNTMGLYGGRFVMDPRALASQLVPRADMDLGASTDALLLPIGNDLNRPEVPANGMIRYSSQRNKFEGYQSGSWQDILTGAASMNAAGSNTQLQFNSNGSFGAVSNLTWNNTATTLDVAGSIKVSSRINMAGHTANLPVNPDTLSALGDVQLGTLTAGQILTYSGGKWVNAAASGGAAAMPGRGIQFNSGGNFAATGNLQYTLGGSLLVTGTNTELGDSSLPTGAGTRMFFDPTKSSFRAGRVAGNEWNYTSVGTYSFAVGDTTLASGSFSAAMGTGSVARGTASFAMGENAQALGGYSMAVGYNTVASGEPSVALGDNSQASGTSSLSVGFETVASGQSSVALGHETRASGNSSIALGESTIASGPASTVMGINTVASGQYSTAMGRNIVVGNGMAGSGFGDGSLAIGLIDDAVAITTSSQVRGIQSMGVFMGDQDGLVMTANNTVGFFGGKMVIDSRVPAQKLSADVELDVWGSIQYTGTLTDVSDRRLKDNILPLNGRGSMLDKLDKIGTYSFTMKDDPKAQIEFGVMAQEINEVFPELVKVDAATAEKYMSVNYVGMIAPLIEASKELKAENEKLKTQISTIEERMASLEGDMNGMKAHTGYGISKAQMGLGMMLGMLLMAGMAGVAMVVVSRRRGIPAKRS